MSPREIIIARSAGFCMGVDLALRKLENLTREVNGRATIYTLGPIIHNPQVLGDYAARGVVIAESPEEVPSGSIVVIRAHGIPVELENELEKKDTRIIDATCPKVKKAQVLIGEFSGEGGKLLLYGEEDHPEVRGLLSYARSGAILFTSLEELKKIPLSGDAQYFLASQTTQDASLFKEIRSYLRNSLSRITVLDTICDATKKRQEEALSLSDKVDYMVVVGGYSSGNTRRLCQVVREKGRPCVHVETPSQLPYAELAGCGKIGLTAGASTPGEVINDVYMALLEV